VPAARQHRGFSSGELRQLRSLRSPAGIQKFLDSLPYHLAMTAWSPRVVLRERTAHCLEGAIFAAAALRVLGYPPLIVDLEAEHDTDHVIAVFQVNEAWGAIATSNFAGCRYREPVYKTVRELSMSYFEDYFNLRRERTLRRYSRPINLGRFDAQHWMTSEKSIWFVPEYLATVRHTPLITTAMTKRLTLVDTRSHAAGLVGQRQKQR